VNGNLRVVTLNFWGTEAPLDRRLALAIRQLSVLSPDVICMQEVRPLDGKSGRTTADEIAAGLGMSARYEVALAWSDNAWPGMAAGQEGLAVIAKDILDTRVLPLPESRPTEARILLSAQVASEGGPVWVHTTHFHYKLDDGLAREQQALAVDLDQRRADETPLVVSRGRADGVSRALDQVGLLHVCFSVVVICSWWYSTTRRLPYL